MSGAGHASLAEVLRDHDVHGQLTPAFRDLHFVHGEHGASIGVLDLGLRAAVGHALESRALRRREVARQGHAARGRLGRTSHGGGLQGLARRLVCGSRGRGGCAIHSGGFDASHFNLLLHAISPIRIEGCSLKPMVAGPAKCLCILGPTATPSPNPKRHPDLFRMKGDRVDCQS